MLCNQCLEPQEKDQRKKTGTTNTVWSEVSDLSCPRARMGRAAVAHPQCSVDTPQGLAEKPARQLVPRDGVRAAPCAAAVTHKRRFIS